MSHKTRQSESGEHRQVKRRKVGGGRSIWPLESDEPVTDEEEEEDDDQNDPEGPVVVEPRVGAHFQVETLPLTSFTRGMDLHFSSTSEPLLSLTGDDETEAEWALEEISAFQEQFLRTPRDWVTITEAVQCARPAGEHQPPKTLPQIVWHFWTTFMLSDMYYRYLTGTSGRQSEDGGQDGSQWREGDNDGDAEGSNDNEDDEDQGKAKTETAQQLQMQHTQQEAQTLSKVTSTGASGERHSKAEGVTVAMHAADSIGDEHDEAKIMREFRRAFLRHPKDWSDMQKEIKTKAVTITELIDHYRNRYQLTPSFVNDWLLGDTYRQWMLLKHRKSLEALIPVFHDEKMCCICEDPIEDTQRFVCCDCCTRAAHRKLKCSGHVSREQPEWLCLFCRLSYASDPAGKEAAKRVVDEGLAKVQQQRELELDKLISEKVQRAKARIQQQGETPMHSA